MSISTVDCRIHGTAGFVITCPHVADSVKSVTVTVNIREYRQDLFLPTFAVCEACATAFGAPDGLFDPDRTPSALITTCAKCYRDSRMTTTC